MPDLSRLLAPSSIAVVGGAAAERVVRQCVKLGFQGPIWPVNPTRSDLAGVACLPSLDDLPGVPDAVFLGVNRHATVHAMEAISRMGAGGAVCYGSGFAESGAHPTCSNHARPGLARPTPGTPRHRRAPSATG